MRPSGYTVSHCHQCGVSPTSVTTKTFEKLFFYKVLMSVVPKYLENNARLKQAICCHDAMLIQGTGTTAKSLTLSFRDFQRTGD